MGFGKYTLVALIGLGVFCLFANQISAKGDTDTEGHLKIRYRRGLKSLLMGKSSSSSTSGDSNNCFCPSTNQPVCGNDRVTYPNACRFKCAFQKKSKLRVVHQGSC